MLLRPDGSMRSHRVDREPCEGSGEMPETGYVPKFRVPEKDSGYVLITENE